VNSDPTAPVDVEDDEEFWLAESGRGLWTISRTAHSLGWFGNPTARTVTALFIPEPENVG
jgi:hypothetical protein